MGVVSTYLNFDGRTEEAFGFYRDAFGSQFLGPILRHGETPGSWTTEGDGPVMHMELPILDGHVLMGTDLPESASLRVGNNVTVNLGLDSREQTQRLYDALAEGGTDLNPPADMPWGQFWGTCQDRFGVRWMFHHPHAPV